MMARKRDKKSRSPEDYGIRTVSCGGGSGFRSTSHPRRKSSQRKRAYEEIAVREGCSYQAVQKSIAAALKKIRKFLK